MIRVLGKDSSIFNQFLAEIRSKEVQIDSMRFRTNLERCAELMAYEISKYLKFEEAEIQTPLGQAITPVLKDDIVIASIMRAAIPMHNGMLRIFDKAGNAFVAAYRNYTEENNFEIALEYITCPNLDGKILILNDPMLATGQSIEIAYRGLLKYGKPKHTYFTTLISSREGLEFIKKNLSEENLSVVTIAVDDELTSKSYIVPGLGDAGDLAFGPKV